MLSTPHHWPRPSHLKHSSKQALLWRDWRHHIRRGEILQRGHAFILTSIIILRSCVQAVPHPQRARIKVWVTMLDIGAISPTPKQFFSYITITIVFLKSLKRFLESWSPFPYHLYWEHPNGAGEMAYQLRVPATLPEDPRSTPSVYMSTLSSLTPVQESLSLCGRLDACGVCECKPGLILLSGNRVALIRVLWSETWTQTFWSECSNSERGSSWACVLLF